MQQTQSSSFETQGKITSSKVVAKKNLPTRFSPFKEISFIFIDEKRFPKTDLPSLSYFCGA